MATVCKQYPITSVIHKPTGGLYLKKVTNVYLASIYKLFLLEFIIFININYRSYIDHVDTCHDRVKIYQSIFCLKDWFGWSNTDQKYRVI